MGAKWTAADIPAQRADKGARVVLLVRDARRGAEAAERIRTRSACAADVQPVDLSSLESVRTAAEAVQDTYPHVDLLINNAGIAMTPKAVTAAPPPTPTSSAANITVPGFSGSADIPSK